MSAEHSMAHITCLNSTPWIVFTNRNSERIRALSWYLIISYQSHNNKNDHLNRPWEGPGLNAWVSRYHYPRSSNTQLMLWKISSADNQGLLLCWLTWETEFTYLQISSNKLLICITIHDATKSWIICLTKPEGLLPSKSQFLMKRTQQKTLRPNN